MEKRRPLSTSSLLKVATFIILISAALSCPGNDTYCLACNGSTCLACGGAYLRDGVCFNSTSVVNNCVSYSANGVCRVCNLGYYLNNGVCSAIGSQFCLSLDQTGKVCTSCAGSTLVNNGVCDLTQKCSDPNCLVCGYFQGVAACGLCMNGYALTNFGNGTLGCANTTQSLINCTVSNPSNTSLCSVCYYNTYFADGSCRPSADYRVPLYQGTGRFLAGVGLIFASIFFR